MTGSFLLGSVFHLFNHAVKIIISANNEERINCIFGGFCFVNFVHSLKYVVLCQVLFCGALFCYKYSLHCLLSIKVIIIQQLFKVFYLTFQKIIPFWSIKSKQPKYSSYP